MVLPVPGVAREQHRDPPPATSAGPHTPVVEDQVPAPGPSGQLAERVGRRRGQHQVVPADRRLDPAGQPFEAGAVLGPGPGPEVVDAHRLARQPGLQPGRLHGPRHLLAGQQELGRDVGLGQLGRRVGAEAGLPVEPAAEEPSRSGCPPPAAPSGSTPAPRPARPCSRTGPGQPGEGPHRAGRPVEQGLHRAGDQPGTGEEGLASDGPGHRFDVLGGVEVVEVDR